MKIIAKLTTRPYQVRIYTLISVLFVSILTGCSTYNYLSGHLNSEDTLCSPSAAYHQGFQDGRRSLALLTNFANSCPSNSTALNSAYQNGYLAGQNSRQR